MSVETIVSEAMAEVEGRVSEKIDAETNYDVLLDAVWSIAVENGLFPDPFLGTCLMAIEDDPKYRSERWVVAVEPGGKRGLPKLSVAQLLWSPSLDEYVDGVRLKLGRVSWSGLEVVRDANSLRWIEENPDGCRGIINFLAAAVPEE